MPALIARNPSSSSDGLKLANRRCSRFQVREIGCLIDASHIVTLDGVKDLGVRLPQRFVILPKTEMSSLRYVTKQETLAVCMCVHKAGNDQLAACIHNGRIGIFAYQRIKPLREIYNLPAADQNVELSATIRRIAGQNNPVRYDEWLCHSLTLAPARSILFVFKNNSRCLQ